MWTMSFPISRSLLLSDLLHSAPVDCSTPLCSCLGLMSGSNLASVVIRSPLRPGHLPPALAVQADLVRANPAALELMARVDRESLLLKELDEYGRDRFRRDVVLLALHGVPSGTPNRLADDVGRVVKKGEGGAAVNDDRRHADGFECPSQIGGKPPLLVVDHECAVIE